ncbi:hypothetical protein PT974_08976 [Cladobotryum mycophilum]|uniref:Ankyrin repeat protein n=1 Tax=Cladobotryum mycophilum TaxID=491253 RepID=A0ABR0SFX1_9HYPO
MALGDLPELPAPLSGLVQYIANHSDKPMAEIMEPYCKYEAGLRSVFAQDHQNPILNDPYINVVPLFTQDTKHITTRARNLEFESEEEKSRYIMALPDDKRRPHGSPATVGSLSEFQKNFNIFSESSLAELDWSNVVAGGSSVINTLLPVPEEFNTNKRKLREYYHQKFCPASDVDLFLYGLTHDQAIEKIKKIEQAIRDSILSEVTVVRTKHAITIASQYPVRHVQIVLRVYKSISEILTGFDIDAAGGAYDGKQVYVTPRALASFITQVNHIDLTRRSPSYENRLSKYSHRNFEVYWPDLDRSRIDPTIFERSFQRTLGLARLLVLERLPTTRVREEYMNKRRQERGRPAIRRNSFTTRGDIKERYEDEVADWLSEEDVSNYHTFTIPYGERFNAKRIEKLCYTKDLLLNAEWNQSKEREVYLHRHPAFFGRVEDVIEDCCGYCPKAVTPEEIEVAEKEAENYISGKVLFLTDDPGRQQIGSFNPVSEKDWTDMAYVGNTARLCQSIVSRDIDDVLNWLSQEGADPNQRDYTGRTPLHLAVMTSSPDIVRSLVDHGSRITARLADGRTALHLAASRGDKEMIKILMEKSIENEAAEEERQTKRRQAAKAGKAEDKDNEGKPVKANDDDSDVDMDDAEGGSDFSEVEDTEADDHSIATGSFVKVKKLEEEIADLALEESEDDPDYYQIDVLAWDIPCSPLHLAISEGHEEAVKLLCDSMALLLLKLGATSSQGDSNGCTAFHRYVESGKADMLDGLLEQDKTGVKTAINHLVFSGSYWNSQTIAPIHTAVEQGDSILVLKLLNAGALSQIDFDTWLKSARVSPSHADRLGSLEDNKKKYRESSEQPLITALRVGNWEAAKILLENGANPNCLTSETEAAMTNEYQRSYTQGKSVLDIVLNMAEKLRRYKGEKPSNQKPVLRPQMDTYLKRFKPGTYQYLLVHDDIQQHKSQFESAMKAYIDGLARADPLNGVSEKQKAIDEAIAGLEELQHILVAKGGLKFTELHPTIKMEGRGSTWSPFTHSPFEVREYDYIFSFNGDQNMTDGRRDGYMKLMDAAWNGDLGTIKSLTLQAWGTAQEQAPLNMAINDSRYNSPFSIAFLRGHYEVAKAILEIVDAQWSAPDRDELRYRMKSHDEDEDEEYSEAGEDEAEEDDSEPQIVSERVDQKFTIDNIGQVSMQVKSHTKPLMVILNNAPSIVASDGVFTSLGLSHSLFQHVIDQENEAGLKILLELAQHYGEKPSEEDEEAAGTFTFPQDVFVWAVEHGKVQALRLIIKKTGAGIPLDHLVKKSGVQLKKKPRKDWATAGRNMVVKTTGIKTPPLLHAALGGNLEGVEFFLSDAPHRLYAEFSKSKTAKEDPRLKHLKESPGGFDRAISKWLGADNDYIIHCALFTTPSEESIELLKYLIDTCPDSLERKTSQGDTPLMIACKLGRPQYVKLLIDGNANQSTRNHKGESILHAALMSGPSAGRLRRVLDMVDPSLRNYLFLQRKNLQENGTTPLHTWITQVCGIYGSDSQYYNPNRWQYSYTAGWKPYKKDSDVVDMLKLLLEYSKGEELDMLNGAGDTCLHTAISSNNLTLVKTLVDFKPQLLQRENAVGRTPAEIAHDRFTANQFTQPSNLAKSNGWKFEEYVNMAPSKFVKDPTLFGLDSQNLKAKLLEVGLSGDYKPMEVVNIFSHMGLINKKPEDDLTDQLLKRIIWDFCQTAMEKHPSNRRLVSLNEANDVARRLGEQHTVSRYFSIQTRNEDGDEEKEGVEEKDEINNDFITSELNKGLGSAWSIDEYEAKEYGITKCPKCDSYHE